MAALLRPLLGSSAFPAGLPPVLQRHAGGLSPSLQRAQAMPAQHTAGRKAPWKSRGPACPRGRSFEAEDGGLRDPLF